MFTTRVADLIPGDIAGDWRVSALIRRWERTEHRLATDVPATIVCAAADGTRTSVDLPAGDTMTVLRVDRDAGQYVGLPPVLVGHVACEATGRYWHEVDLYAPIAEALGRQVVTYEVDDVEQVDRDTWAVKATVRYLADADETALLAAHGLVPIGPPNPTW